MKGGLLKKIFKMKEQDDVDREIEELERKIEQRKKKGEQPRIPDLPDYGPKKEENVQVIEREVNLKLINDKLNMILNGINSLMSKG